MALTPEVTPAHAPQPRNVSERFVFAQLYETLVREDCEGRIYPGLARSWTVDEPGRRWTFVLRDDARFWNGDPLTARDVTAAWRAAADSAASPDGLPRRLAEATTVVDDSTLIVALPDSQPLVLADGALAIRRPRPGSPWPEGTGRYYIAGERSAAGYETIDLLPVVRGAVPRISVRVIGRADARDLIDAGLDLLLTDDPAAVSYAEARPDLTTVPLPWSRTYVLLSPRHAPDSEAASPLTGEAGRLRAALARDAVRTEARAAEPPFWWSDVEKCEVRSAGTPASSAPGQGARVVYRRDDNVARELAERLVALAAIGGTVQGEPPLASLAPELLAAGARTRAAALSPAELAGALHAGSELAYVLDLPRRSRPSCRDVAALVALAPWLAAAAGTALGVVPLVETRDRAILRRDRVAFSIDGDGTLRLIDAAPYATERPR